MFSILHLEEREANRDVSRGLILCGGSCAHKYARLCIIGFLVVFENTLSNFRFFFSPINASLLFFILLLICSGKYSVVVVSVHSVLSLGRHVA